MNVTLKEQEETIREMKKIFEVFLASEGLIRPHFVLTGISGSGKSYAINVLAEELDIEMIEINAAQLTKEGTAGNSLSKALTPLANRHGSMTIVFVDEFDKLFISGNSNHSLAHEITNGVQNEFLKILESDNTSVFGDYGHYIQASVKHVLFVFAGAFNGEENITIDRLREFGVKTEFIGRVGLIYNLAKPSLDSLRKILHKSELLDTYLELFPDVNKKDVITCVEQYLEENYEHNSLGVRIINTLICQYFIKGGEVGMKKAVKNVTFQKKLSL